jgi:hypothetical protein
MYRVLWIDDQFEDPEMIQFAIEAENDGLRLEGYTSFEEGFEALEKNLSLFDVILLDGLFFEKKSQVVGTEDESGLGMAIAKINEFKTKKVFPWFVLSGKDKFTKGENSLLKANRAQCFDKTNPSDVVKLFEQMKTAADNQVDSQLKFKYAAVLDSISDKYLGTSSFSRLFSIIKHIENVERLSNTEDMLNPLRKIVERMFSRLGKLGLIPEQIISNQGWVNGSSHFLSNRHSEYEHLSEFIPSLIGENIHRLLNITHDASHGEGNLKLKADQYIQSANSDYLYRSCIFLVFDILLWFKSFVDKNPDVEINKKLWREKELPGGIIEQDDSKNFFCDKYLLNKSLMENFKIGDSIVITKESENIKPYTMKTYPKFAITYRKK